MVKPDKTSPKLSEIIPTIFGWLFIIGALGGIVYMIATARPQKRLVCEGTYTAMTGFGSCHTE